LGGAIVWNYVITRRSEYFTTGHIVVILWSSKDKMFELDSCAVFVLQMAKV